MPRASATNTIRRSGRLKISSERRQQYAAEVAALCGITDPAVRSAFAKVPREAFLPPGPWLIEAADASVYLSADDNPEHILHGVGVVLDRERSLHCGSPARVGRAIQAARLKPAATVLHVGSGLGYYSAIMAELVGPSGRVIAAEIEATLAEGARKNLSGWRNVEVTGDALSETLPPLDAVFASCGMATIPRRWLEALRPGGRMVVPLTGSTDGGNLFIIARTASSAWFHIASMGLVHFYPCCGLRDQADVLAIDLAMSKRRGLSVHSLRLDRHRPTRECWLHKDDWCLTTVFPT